MMYCQLCSMQLQQSKFRKLSKLREHIEKQHSINEMIGFISEIVYYET